MPSKFNIVKRGYDPAEVDEYIETLESVLKSYKEKDTAIKNAILNAQVAADNIILNAKNRSYEIKENSIAQINDILSSVKYQKQLVNNFVREYNEQVRKYLHEVNINDIAAVNEKIDELENYLLKFTNEQPELFIPKPQDTLAEPTKTKPEDNINPDEAEAIKNIFAGGN